MNDDGMKKHARVSLMALPPVPDLIPLEDLGQDGLEDSVSDGENSDEKSKRRIRVMREQRAQRVSRQLAGAEEIDSPSRRLTQASPFKTGSKRHRKLTHRRREYMRKRPNDISSSTATDEAPANPRVNPIFLWVRQEDTKIVDVKCEDYDKRNRILLTKTAHGWRAIPRTESLSKSPVNSENCAPRIKKRKRHRKKKTKCKAIGVQVEETCFKTEEEEEEEEIEETNCQVNEEKKDTEEEIQWDKEINIESHIPTHTIHISRPPSQTPAVQIQKASTGIEQLDSSSLSSPLDKLLAVAELELKSVEGDTPMSSANSEIDRVKDLDDKTESYLDNLVLENAQTDNLQITGINYNELQGDYCDYNEEDDNTLVMDDILNRLEQSLGNPESASIEETNNNDKLFEHEMACEKILEENEPFAKENFEMEITDLTPIEELAKQIEEEAEEQHITSEAIAEVEEILPTDLSCAKRTSHTPPLEIKIQRTFDPETIQSPEPSGIPAVTPDLTTSSSPNHSCSEVTHDEPLDLGKPRKSESPLVSCSEEIQQSSCNLKNEIMKITAIAKQDAGQNVKVLEKSPFEQLQYILKYTKLRIPDPLLVPKDRLNVILTTPATEIPRLLFDRPELKLPDALAFPHLLEDPDILVITITQLQSILRKHFQTKKIEEFVLKETDVTSTAKITTTQPSIAEPEVQPVQPVQQQKSTAVVKSTNKKAEPKPPKASSESKAKQTNEILPNMRAPVFNQWMWMPYLYQLEAAAMAYDNKINDFMKSCPNPYNVYPSTYQYQNPMPQQSVPFSFQQELMKLSSMQTPPAELFSPKKMKYSGLVPEHAPLRPAKHQQSRANFKANYNPNLSVNCPSQWLNQPANLQHHQNPSDVFSSYKHKPSNRNYRNNNNNNHNNNNNNNNNSNSNSNSNNANRLNRSAYSKAAEARARAEAMRALSNRAISEQMPPMDLRPFGIVQPIDLSNSRAGRGGYKGEQINMTRLALLRNDDVAEVGSTTSCLEEAQIQHHHCDTTHPAAGLWHPLFGK